MDAITLLKADHREVEKLFKAYEKAGDNAKTTKRRTVKKIIAALSVHAAIEEQVFYPAVRAAVEDVEDDVLESMEEHHVVKWLLSEIDKLDVDDERYNAKVTVLIENVRHHVEEEEQDLFPEVRAALGRKRLAEIGETMQKLQKTAPTKPHPRAPDTPPGNLIVGAVAGVVDNAREKLGV